MSFEHGADRGDTRALVYSIMVRLREDDRRWRVDMEKRRELAVVFTIELGFVERLNLVVLIREERAREAEDLKKWNDTQRLTEKEKTKIKTNFSFLCPIWEQYKCCGTKLRRGKRTSRSLNFSLINNYVLFVWKYISKSSLLVNFTSFIFSVALHYITLKYSTIVHYLLKRNYIAWKIYDPVNKNWEDSNMLPNLIINNIIF